MKSFVKWMMLLLPSMYVFRSLLFGGNEEVYVAVSLLLFLFCSGYSFVFYVLLKQVSFPTYIIMYGLLILYLAISLTYMSYTFMIPSAISLLITYLTILFLVVYIIHHKLFWLLYAYYAYGIVCLCMLLYFLSIFSLAGIQMIDNRFGWVSFHGEYIVDPNYFAVFIGLALFYFYFICTQKSVRANRRLLHGLFFVLLGYFFIATLSRGVAITFILSILLSLLIIHRTKTNTILAVYGGTLVILLLTGFIQQYGSSQASAIQYTSFNRFLLLDTSNRLDLWSAILKGFFHSDVFIILFGNGFQSGSSIGAKYFYGVEPTVNHQIFINPHNMFLQFFVEIGIIGSFLLFIFFIILCRQLVKSLRRNNPIPLYLLLFFLGVNMSLNIFGLRELILSFLIFLFSSFKLDSSPVKGVKR